MAIEFLFATVTDRDGAQRDEKVELEIADDGELLAARFNKLVLKPGEYLCLFLRERWAQ